MERVAQMSGIENGMGSGNFLFDWGIGSVDGGALNVAPRESGGGMSRRGFLKSMGVGAATAVFSTNSLATLLNTSNGVIEKPMTPSEKAEKVFYPKDLENIFSKNEIIRDDYYFPNALSADKGKLSPFINERIKKGVVVLEGVPVVYPETPEKKEINKKPIFDSIIKLDLPISQDIKDELIKAENNTNDGKKVKKVVGHGLIVEAETVKGKGWVILPPGTLIARLDDKVVIASCLNPIYKIEERKCPPCSN